MKTVYYYGPLEKGPKTGRFFDKVSACGRAVKVEDRGRAVSRGAFFGINKTSTPPERRTIKDTQLSELAHNNAGAG